jgi:hypothetical protein
MEAFSWCVVEISVTVAGGNAERGNPLFSANHSELDSRQKILLLVERVGRQIIRQSIKRSHAYLFNTVHHMKHAYYDRFLENKQIAAAGSTMP